MVLAYFRGLRLGPVGQRCNVGLNLDEGAVGEAKGYVNVSATILVQCFHFLSCEYIDYSMLPAVYV